jgi:hypothetical protein
VASAVSKGKTVLVLGKVNSTTITASQVIVGPAVNLSKASASVISFKKGSQSASKTVGQVPTSYKEGSAPSHLRHQQFQGGRRQLKSPERQRDLEA